MLIYHRGSRKYSPLEQPTAQQVLTEMISAGPITVLITGAAGSIGSEIVRQVIGFNPKVVVILDQAESNF